MAEYIERGALLEKSINGIVAAIDVLYAPAADVVEVVRCKDCKYYKRNTWVEDGKFVCRFWVDQLSTEEDDFCSYGERRSDNG